MELRDLLCAGGVALAVAGAPPPALVCADTPASRQTRTTAAPNDVYRMQLRVHPEQGGMQGRVELDYRNGAAMPLLAIRLRLDLNLSPGCSMEVLGVETPEGKPLARSNDWTARRPCRRFAFELPEI